MYFPPFKKNNNKVRVRNNTAKMFYLGNTNTIKSKISQIFIH